jgi:hypothetical protein
MRLGVRYGDFERQLSGDRTVSFGSILLKNSVFKDARKIAGPEGLRRISDVGGDPIS